MTKIEAINHFGTQREMARALGIHEQSIQKWPDVVPEKWETPIKNALVMLASKMEARAKDLRAAAGV